VNELDDQTAAALEDAMDRGSKLLTTLSNILKDAEDSRKATTQNLK
jgi:hypothetical protein